MKNILKLFILSSFCFAIISCGNDDDSCSPAMLAGTYTGVNDCDPSDPMDMTITVSANGDQIDITGDDGSVSTFTMNDCQSETLTESFDFFGIQIETSTNFAFTETAVTFNLETTAAGTTETCSIVLTKQ